MAICLDVQLSCCGLVTLVTFNLIYDYQTNLNPPSFFHKQLLYKQQRFKNLQIKQSEGFKILN